MAPQPEFMLPLSLDLGATFLFGMTGALVALNRGYDVVGVFALAFLTGVGGGLIRDGVFLQHGPPFVTTGSGYVIVIVVSCFAARLFHRRLARLDQPIAVVEALGLGAYGVIGVQKCLVAGLGVAAAIFVGVISAVGGGVLRDVVVREEPVLFKPGQFCALAVFVGCCLYTLLTLQFGMQLTMAAYITIAVTFALRILAIRFDWRTRAMVPGSGSGSAA